MQYMPNEERHKIIKSNGQEYKEGFYKSSDSNKTFCYYLSYICDLEHLRCEYIDSASVKEINNLIDEGADPFYFEIYVDTKYDVNIDQFAQYFYWSNPLNNLFYENNVKYWPYYLKNLKLNQCLDRQTYDDITRILKYDHNQSYPRYAITFYYIGDELQTNLKNEDKITYKETLYFNRYEDVEKDKLQYLNSFCNTFICGDLFILLKEYLYFPQQLKKLI